MSRQPPSETSEPSLRRRVLPVLVVAFTHYLSVGATFPTVPRFVEQELEGNGLEVGMGVGALAVASVFLRPFSARFGDRHGRRVLVTGGAALSALSLLGYGLATSLPVFVLLRLLTGAGHSTAGVGMATAVQDTAPDNRRGEAAAYYSAGSFAGFALGPVVGEMVLRAHGFGAVWLMAGGLGLTASLLARRIKGGDFHPSTGKVSLLQRNALGLGVVFFMGQLPYVAFIAFMPLYAERVGISNVGTLFAVFGAAALAGRLVTARLPDRLGWYASSRLSLASVAAAGAVLALWPSQMSAWVATIVMPAGMSLMMPGMTTAVLAVSPRSERTQAMGTLLLFTDLSQSLGAVALGGAVTLGGNRAAFAVAAFTAAAGLLVQAVVAPRLKVLTT